MSENVKVRMEVGGGIDQFISDLNRLDANVEEMSKRSIYEGANVLANAIRKNIERLQVGEHVKGEKSAIRLTDYEKKGMLDGLGVASMKQTGQIIDTKIGMHGYNKHKTKKYPQGQPNAMIARSVEKGTSFRKPQPFIQPAVEQYRNEAENAMSAEFDRQIGQIMK